MEDSGLKIVVLEGEMAGQEFPLSFDFTSIGRGEGVDVQLHTDNSISRRHAVIRREYGRFILEDLGSTNGTFIFKEDNEEEEVIHAVLTDGSRFRVGKTLLRLIRSNVGIGIEPNQYDTLEVVADTPADYAIRSSFDPEMINQTNFLQVPEDSKSAEELNHKIKVFYELGQALGKIMDMAQLLEKVMDYVFEMFPAQRGYLMMLNDRTNELEIRVVRKKAMPGREDSNNKIEVSKTIINWVLREKKAVLSDDARIDERFGMPDSVFLHDIRASLYAPLMYERRPIGILCIDNFTSSHVFTENDLRFLTIIANQAAISIENSRLHQHVQRLFLSSIRALANAIEARDKYTRGHSERVTAYAVRISEKMKMAGEEVEKIRYAALLHDIGKIKVREDILNKPGKLTEEEFKIMSLHPVYGSRIMEPVDEFQEMLPFMYHHHERYDAAGYPDHLEGEDIPLASRILAVADTFDAMTSDRPYRNSLSLEHAVGELRRNSGTQFDSRVVTVFLDIIEEDPEWVNKVMKMGTELKDSNDNITSEEIERTVDNYIVTGNFPDDLHKYSDSGSEGDSASGDGSNNPHHDEIHKAKTGTLGGLKLPADSNDPDGQDT